MSISKFKYDHLNIVGSYKRKYLLNKLNPMTGDFFVQKYSNNTQIKNGEKEKIKTLENELYYLKNQYNNFNIKLVEFDCKITQLKKLFSITQNKASKIEDNNFFISYENTKNYPNIDRNNNKVFEEYKLSNDSKMEKMENSIAKVIKDLESFKIQINNRIKFGPEGLIVEKEKNNNELLKIKNLIEQNTKQSIEFENRISKIVNNINPNNDWKKQKEEFIKRNEHIDKLLKKNNESINELKEELEKQNEELKNFREDENKINQEVKFYREKFKEENKTKSKESEEIKKKIEELKDDIAKIINQLDNQNKQNIKKTYNEKYGRVGLYNIGNSCYMNSVLQILKNIPQFTYNILKLNDNHDNFLSQLKNLFFNLCDSNAKAFTPKEFKKYLVLEKLGKSFAGNNQHDSNLFYMSLLNIIDNKLNSQKIPKIDKSKYEGKNLSEMIKIYKENDFSSKKETFIYDLFYIYYAYETKCEKCKCVFYKLQKSNLLDFPIVTDKGNVKSLEECFENYQKKYEGEDNCSNCQKFGITRKCILLEIPPILIIYLKRVGDQSVYLNDIKIPFKLDMGKIVKSSINFSTSLYELRGFIKHEGDAKSGHNYSFCKNMFDDKWYEYNDNMCKDVYYPLKLDKIFFLCYIKNGFEFENSSIIEKIVEILNKKA